MQCTTSFIPVYYQSRTVNGTGSGFPWQLLNSNANYGEQRVFNNSSPPSTVYSFLNYDKEMMRQTIQNHEATFRYQVQELHRLYKRQRELMDETRIRETVTHHLLSQTSESIQCMSQPRSDISQTSNKPSWLLGDHSHSKLPDPKLENIHQSPIFTTDNFPEHRKDNCKEYGKRILDLELPADMYCDNEVKQFKEGNISNVQPTSDSETGDLSHFNSNGKGKMNCLIDLNEPVMLESLSSNSTHASSDGRNSSMVIDLNCIPEHCFSEVEGTVENIPEFKKNCDEETVIKDKFMEADTKNDLNSSVAGKSEEAPMETTLPLVSEKKPALEPEIVAAEILIVISSLSKENTIPQTSENTCLDWFADIVSSMGDDLTKLDNFETSSLKLSERNNAGKAKEGITEATGRQRRNRGKKASVKPRKDSIKKSTVSILKQPATRSRQGVLQNWGKMRKRQEGHRRRSSKFLVI